MIPARRAAVGEAKPLRKPALAINAAQTFAPIRRH